MPCDDTGLGTHSNKANNFVVGFMKHKAGGTGGRLRLMVSTEEPGGATFNVSYNTSLCASASNTGAGSHSVNQNRTTVVDLCPELRNAYEWNQ